MNVSRATMHNIFKSDGSNYEPESLRVMLALPDRPLKHNNTGADPGFQKGGGVDGRPYLLRGGRENALTKKIGNNFSCTCLRRVF